MSAEAFQWTDKFLLGYGPMDEVHREFVELVNALLTCSNEEMSERLAAFAAHAESHFSDELKWMKATDFPSTDCHVDEHNAVLKSVREVQEVLVDGRFDVVRGLAQELVRWFPGHADYMDSALAHWIIKKRHGGAPIVLRRGIKTAAPVED